jgi:hypothetical protein
MVNITEKIKEYEELQKVLMPSPNTPLGLRRR